MRVVIGEDEALLREGLRLVLEREGFEVVAAVADAEEVVAASARTGPDLVLTDLRMPPTRTDDGLRAAQRIRADQPGTAVVVLSQHVNGQYAAELLGERASAVGYLLKQRIADAGNFCRDLVRVAEGGVALDPEVVTAMLARRDDAVERLSPRRLGVLALIAQGRSNAAIGRLLGISEKSVVAHASGIYDTLGLSNDADDHRRVLAVVRYLTR
ncbi:response regulator transcription factor [Pseudonocardia charpentierae]|uniref:Response regulator transcription factor n=1 Tax=Pseudonocardia charpentierae TaxID=3075545 RepID=A0ABU2NGN4_9PSEU|nr:response regulator transcription factor [Pseudonocardia sp. DSM 45834]MDT0353044.1 response regulator transcription factor [Pseudonocardia sp. DSM 45834]